MDNLKILVALRKAVFFKRVNVASPLSLTSSWMVQIRLLAADGRIHTSDRYISDAESKLCTASSSLREGRGPRAGICISLPFCMGTCLGAGRSL